MKRILSGILIAAAILLTAQTPKVLTNQDVLDMVGAKLSDSVIVSAIRTSTCKFSTGAQDLIALKKAGVSDAVMEAMTEAGAPAPARRIPGLAGAAANASGATPSPGTETSGDPNDPMAPHDSGIYLYTKDRDGKPEMVALERAAEQATKTGGMLGSAMTYGIKKAKTKAVIPGAHAGIQTADVPPVFYFYFDDKQAGLGKTHFGMSNVSNPNQFALLKLDVKKSDRETIIGQFSALGMSSGSDTKSMIPFKSERVRTGLYKVVAQGIEPGEYCFLALTGPSTGIMGAYGAGASATDIFDFGVSTR